MALYTKTFENNQRKHNKSRSLSFTAKAVFSLLSTVTLSPTSILMLEVSCQSARHGLLHFYSAAVLPVLPVSVTVSCLITNFSSNSLALQIFSTS